MTRDQEPPADSPNRSAASTGSAGAWLGVLYDQLRIMAAERLRGESAGHTLQPTALVHEVWLRLARQAEGEFKDEGQFRAAAAQSMRQILIDHARRKKADKRGGGRLRVALEEVERDQAGARDGSGLGAGEVDILQLEEAMERLRKLDERKLRVVELRFFGGMTMKQIGEALRISPKTAEADWYMARAWLRTQLEPVA